MRTLIVTKLFAVISSVVLALAALAVPAAGNAQSALLQVNVPFGFESGSNHFAPGVYNIHTSNSTQIIRIEGHGTSAFQMTLPDKSATPAEISKVVFARYGSQYILKEVWVAGSTLHSHTPKSKLEKELQLAQNNSKNPGYLALLAMPR